MTDVVIVGSGAGGGPLAWTLSRAGLDVLVLERGPAYTREDYRHDEVAITRRDFWIPAMSDDMHVLQKAGNPFPQPSHLGWTGNCVGGGTVQMGGYLYRFHPDDFRMKSRFGGFEELADWPFEYDALEPYYSQAEWEVGLSGQGGSNPFEGPRSRPYPMPPLESHPMSERLDHACEARGWHAFPTPRAVASRAYQDRDACAYCGFCAGYGCHRGAKSSTQEALLPRAVATGRCEVRPLSRVREVTVSRDGRATGCVYLDAEGAEHKVRAAIVCVCCSAVESARLLLLSTSSRFPDGLANGNGLVGRHLQFHAFSNGHAWFRLGGHPELALDDPHPFLERSVMDHYFLPEGVSALPKGGLLRFGFPSASPIGHAIRVAEREGKLAWGPELKERLGRYFRGYRMVDFEVFHDFLPNRGTFVALDPQIKDRWGLPVARIHLEEPEHHRQAGAFLVERGLEVLEAMGADEVVREEIGETASYLVHGTCRAGHDPATSVLNPWCEAHEVPNLFVVDGSFMPTSGGAPPTLTILANSFRVADHIAARARAGEFSGAAA